MSPVRKEKKSKTIRLLCTSKKERLKGKELLLRHDDDGGAAAG